MATMTETERVKAWEDHMRDKKFDALTALKTDARALIDAADTFVNQNKSVYNQLIPVGSRVKFNDRQKALALVNVINERFILGKDD